MLQRQIIITVLIAGTTFLVSPAYAQSSADIDPGRLGFNALPSRAIIDPQPLHVDRLNMNGIDPQAIRMDSFHFQPIDPGKAIQPNVAPQWIDSRALTIPTLGIGRLDPGRLSMFEQDPGNLEPGRLHVQNPIFNPIDPGRLTVDPIETTRIDPGALSRQGTQRRMRVGGSTIFLSSPVSRLGGPTSDERPTNTGPQAGALKSTVSDPRFMPLKW